MSERLQAHFQGGQQQLPEVPITKRLSERVFVALGMNPSAFSLRGTNTYIVGTGKKRILIDTGDADFTGEYIPVLKRALAESGGEGLEQIIVTHWHRDHVGGVKKVLEAFGPELPVRKIVPLEGAEVVWSGGGGEGETSSVAALDGCRLEPLADGEIVRTEGATLRVLYTPGHANDHAVLVLEEERAMFTGDNVLGTGTPVFRDLPLYLRSLRRMQAEKPLALYTSHGPAVEDGEAYMAEYIGHRTARIDQVKEKLAKAGGAWLTAEEVTRSIYTQHPEHLIGPATGNTVQALRVLREEGSVACDIDAPDAANPYTGAAPPPPQLLKARWQIVARGAPAARL